MSEEILRKYLEIKSPDDLNEVLAPNSDYSLNLVDKKDFQLNKFFYKQIGKNCQWTDRLIWTNQNWISYISKKNLSTFVLNNNENIVGYFELIFYKDKKEVEIAYFGILEEYFGNRLGGFLLSEAIKKSFSIGAERVWVHTCSLDHKNALKNYLARGMSIFKTETLIGN